MLLLRDLTRTILSAFRTVYEAHSHGFPEIVYRRSMARELRDRGCDVVTEAVFNVGYKDEIVGTFKVDLLVDGLVIVEIKAATAIVAEHRTQLFNYLRASQRRVGLVLNFGPEPGIKRIVGPV